MVLLAGSRLGEPWPVPDSKGNILGVFGIYMNKRANVKDAFYSESVIDMILAGV